MKNYRIEIKWGLIFTGVSLLWMVLERAVGLHSTYIDQHPVYTNLFAIVAIAVYVFALRDKRENFYGGTMNWMQGFVSGIIISGVVALLSPLAQWITHTVITPDYFPNVIQHAVDTGTMTREDAEAYFNLRAYIMQSAGFALIVGILTSAIVAIFVRKKAAGGQEI